MAFRLPTFNLTVNLWRSTSPYTGPPDVVTVGNLSPGRFVSMYSARTWPAPGGSDGIQMILRVPALTDIRANQAGHALTFDIAEVPAGTGRYYFVAFVDDVAKGFPNEYRFAILQVSTIVWPIPMP